MALFKTVEIQTNKSLLPLNTFGIDVQAKYFAEITEESLISEVLTDKKMRDAASLVLGGGSNVLFTKDFNGLVLKNSIRGLEVLRENDHEVELRVGAGENWHSFVMHCVEKGYGGVENLSLIPGNVGASPMQNIGAYGVEVKNCVVDVEYIDLGDMENTVLKAEECEFGYRTSIFKTRLKGRIFIHHVTFRLSKKPKLNTSYGAIEQELERLGLEASIANISQAVINIRRSKLPDPKEIGNAGSFFKNPVVTAEFAESLKKEFDNIPLYRVSDDSFKVAAGWLIEQAGWKGKRMNGYGVHEKQALVLVNYGNSQGEDINALAESIQKDILEKFDIALEKEVNII